MQQIQNLQEKLGAVFCVGKPYAKEEVGRSLGLAGHLTA